jgi:hypothetical protein
MAKLPNADRAVIDDKKITGYLLCDTHHVGGPKSAFFKRFGFSSDRPEELAGALLAHAAACEVQKMITSSRGTKYEISGPLQAPDGRLPLIESVWILLAGDSVPRLVTAVPD